VSGRLVSRIVIERFLTEEGGDVVEYQATSPDGNALPVIETLGMLSLTEDSVLHAPGESNED
jgi:hypothetical protein